MAFSASMGVAGWRVCLYLEGRTAVLQSVLNEREHQELWGWPPLVFRVKSGCRAPLKTVLPHSGCSWPRLRWEKIVGFCPSVIGTPASTARRQGTLQLREPGLEFPDLRLLPSELLLVLAPLLFGQPPLLLYLVQQHGVHEVVAHGLGRSILVGEDEFRCHVRHFL